MIKGVKREMKVKRLSDTNLKLYIVPFKNYCAPENITFWFGIPSIIVHIFFTHYFNTFHLYLKQWYI